MGKIILILILLYLIFELGLFFYKYTHRPDLPDIDQSQKTLGTGPGLRYIAAGDSTAVGVGASETEKTHAYQIAENLSEAHTVVYKNIGVIGATTKDVLEKQIDEIVAYEPDIVTVSIGGNDATHLVSRKAILHNYENIVARLEQETTAQIYITNTLYFKGANILPWFYIALIEYRSKSLNRKILDLESDRIHVVNIHDFGWSQFPDMRTTYAADRFHPNDTGYANWLAAFLDKITKL